MNVAVFFRGDALYLLEGADKVAAVGKTRFLTDVVEVVVGKNKIVGRLAYAQIVYKLLAALAVNAAETLGKVGITHAAALGKLGNAQILRIMSVNILGYGVNRVGIRGRGAVFEGKPFSCQRRTMRVSRM